MTPDEREKMNYLCARIQSEKDPEAFENLLRQLNEVLAATKERINAQRKAAQN